MKYYALLEQEKKGLSVTFPDFPECVTFGADEDEAVDMAHEALAMFVELMLENGESLPEPSDADTVKALPAAKNKKMAEVNVSADGSDFEAVEVEFHTYLLERMVEYADQHGVSPADFLSVAVREAIRNDVFKS